MVIMVDMAIFFEKEFSREYMFISYQLKHWWLTKCPQGLCALVYTVERPGNFNMEKNKFWDETFDILFHYHLNTSKATFFLENITL